MNQREYLIISKQLENINRTLSIVENSNSLINHLLNNSNTPNNRRRREYRNYNIRNNMNNDAQFSNILNNTFENNNENNETNQTYVLRFDSLIPNLSNLFNNIQDNSYNYRIYNYDNSNVSINEISTNYDLINIKHFELIENPINDICPITRERFYNTQNVMMIGRCKHIFNKSSLNIWTQNNNTCPSCRTLIHSTTNSNTENQNNNEEEGENIN